MTTMQKRINAAKKEYFLAKERIDALKKREEELEKLYIMEQGIKNPDGSIPCCIFAIEDEDEFERANEAFVEQMKPYNKEYNSSHDAFGKAEQELIECAIAISPPGVRETLEHGANCRADIRQKLIDLILRLDVSTLPC